MRRRRRKRRMSSSSKSRRMRPKRRRRMKVRRGARMPWRCLSSICRTRSRSAWRAI